jgi:uncharacterized membrane protein YdjX (TVP38/TMEM64 family)
MAENGWMQRGATVRRLLPLTAAVAAGAIVVALAGGPQEMFAAFGEERARLAALVAQLGFAAVLAYILVYAGLMTLLWIPAWLCTVIGGFLFGIWVGALSALVGATAGATAVFLLGRRGLGGLTRRAGPFVRRIEAEFRADAFSCLLVLRLVPVMPFVASNLVPAILGMPLRSYVLATLLGILPSTLVYAGLGNGLRSLADAPVNLQTLSRPEMFLPLAGLALLAALPIAVRRWRLRHRRAPSADAR